MDKRKLTVAVTGLNATDNPGPGIPVIRGIKESPYFDIRIIGLAYENLEPGIFLKDLIDKTYLIPYPSNGQEIMMNRINYIHSKEKFNMLIPNFDAELFTFIKLEKQLKSMGIHTFLPTIRQFEERHKAYLPEFGKKYDIMVPFSKSITTIEEVYNIKYDFSYPVVLKGKFYDAYVVYNEEQAIAAFNRVFSKWGAPVIIQQYVSGTEVNVIALGDGEGKVIAAVPMRKQYITDKGKAWGGITVEDDKMMELTNKIIRSTKWRGGMELELIKTADERYYLIEINPRIPAWVYLAVGAGQNIPEALIRLALGEKVKPFKDYKTGTMFIRYSYDLIGDIKQFEKLTMNGEL